MARAQGMSPVDGRSTVITPAKTNVSQGETNDALTKTIPPGSVDVC